MPSSSCTRSTPAPRAGRLRSPRAATSSASSAASASSEPNATRPLPELEAVADWLAANLPEAGENTVVHGDYRLGNVMFAPPAQPHSPRLLDWEMATLGDPLADLGYMTAMWAEPDDPPEPDARPLRGDPAAPASPAATTSPRRYAERTGRDLSTPPWYQALALWKAAIFLEGSYAPLTRRHHRRCLILRASKLACRCSPGVR